MKNTMKTQKKHTTDTKTSTKPAERAASAAASTPATPDAGPPRSRVSQTALIRAHLPTLRALARELGLPPALTEDDRNRLRGRAILSRGGVAEAIASAADTATELGFSHDLDTARVRETIAYAAAAEALLTQLRDLGIRLEDEVLRRRAEVGVGARDTYALLKGLSHSRAGGELATFLSTVKAELKPSRPRKAKRDKPVAPKSATG